MKKLIAMILVILLFTGTSCAEGRGIPLMTAEEKAYDIYLDIAHVYEMGVRYMEEFDYAWCLSMEKSLDSINRMGYGDCMNTNAMTAYIGFLLFCGQTKAHVFDELNWPNRFYVTRKTDVIWELLDIHVLTGYLTNPADLKIDLEHAMKDIQSLMTEYPNYPHTKMLQNYYKEAANLVSYIGSFSDNYVGFSEKYTIYRNGMENWRIDFEFIFGNSEVSAVMTFRAEEREKEKADMYARAVAYEADGNYKAACWAYNLCGYYHDASERAAGCYLKYRLAQ